MAAVEETRVQVSPAAALTLALPPPPPRLPDPQRPLPDQLRELLRHYREHGAAFDVAWELALALVAWPESRRDASEWRYALTGTREGWRATYEGWPPEPRELAAAELSRILSDELRQTAA